MATTDTIRFVHCADLHLDSPFEGLRAVAPAQAQVLREATFTAFERVVDLAVRERAHFLLVAGDVYDGADRSLRAQLRFRDGLLRAAEHGITCLVAHGNHDPLSGWEADLRLPESVHRFPAQVEQVSVRTQGDTLAVVQGISYARREESANLARRFTPADRGGPLTVGLLHCNVAGNPEHENYAPCSREDLRAAGLDYWALGHVHTPAVLGERDPCVIYPGNTQGRSVRETGPRGCYLVEVSPAGEIHPRFVPTDAVRWCLEAVNASPLETVDDLLEQLQGRLEQVRVRAEGRPALVRLRLEGRSALHPALTRPGGPEALAARLREEESDRDDFVWVEKLQNATRSAVDRERRGLVEDFVGDLLRLAEELRGEADLARRAQELLAGVDGYPVISEILEEYSYEDWQQILEAAESWALDRLVGEEG